MSNTKINSSQRGMTTATKINTKASRDWK